MENQLKVRTAITKTFYANHKSLPQNLNSNSNNNTHTISKGSGILVSKTWRIKYRHISMYLYLHATSGKWKRPEERQRGHEQSVYKYCDRWTGCCTDFLVFKINKPNHRRIYARLKNTICLPLSLPLSLVAGYDYRAFCLQPTAQSKQINKGTNSEPESRPSSSTSCNPNKLKMRIKSDNSTCCKIYTHYISVNNTCEF